MLLWYQCLGISVCPFLYSSNICKLRVLCIGSVTSIWPRWSVGRLISRSVIISLKGWRLPSMLIFKVLYFIKYRNFLHFSCNAIFIITKQNFIFMVGESIGCWTTPGPSILSASRRRASKHLFPGEIELFDFCICLFRC